MTSLSVEEFKALQSDEVQLLDSRLTNEFASSVIPNSVNASLNGSYEYMASSIFNKEKQIVVICEEGREGESLLRLESEGFKHISTFNFNLWKDNETLSIGRCQAKDAHTYVDLSLIHI